MPRIAKSICLLCLSMSCHQANAQPDKANNTKLKLLYLRATAQSARFDLLKQCDDLTITRYRELGVDIIEQPYSDLTDWIEAQAVDLTRATSHMQYVAYAKVQNVDAIGGLTATNLKAREAGWRNVEAGLYIHGWSVNLAAICHQHIVDVSSGSSAQAIPLFLAGSMESPWSIANHVSPSVCQSTEKKLREFTSNDINGKEIDTKDFKGKVVLVDFWATWCKPCMDEFPIMQALRATLPESDFIWVSVSVDEDDRAWRQVVKANHLSGIQIRDEKVLWKRIFAVSSYPSAFVIDRDGIIRCKVRGDAIPKAVFALLSKDRNSVAK